MDPNSVTVGLAMLAGLASFLSPCVLPLVPIYVGYLSGQSMSSSGQPDRHRWTTFFHGLAFVIGFSVVFVTLGVAASLIGALLYSVRIWLMRIGGVVIVVFGLHMMGVINVPLLNYDTRRQMHLGPKLGYLSSALMGVFFSAGWTPCVGPVLGAVLTLALSGSQITQGVILLSAYSAGMAVPFLLAALGIDRVTGLMRRYGRAIHIVSVVTGALMVFMGGLMLLGLLEQFLAQLTGLFS